MHEASLPVGDRDEPMTGPEIPAGLLIEAKIIGQKSIWKNADYHGWHNPPATLPEDLLLIHSEISEACEGYRQGKIHMCKPDGTVEFNGSVEEELADAVIRIFHVAEKNGIDICRAVFIKHQRNIARPFRHGNKVL